MWYSPKIMVPVSEEPVSLAMAKQQCRAETYDNDGKIVPSIDDALFSLLIEAARDHVEKICGRYFAACEVEAYCDDFSDLAHVDISPVNDVVAITYTAPTGAEETVLGAQLELREQAMHFAICLKSGLSWPTKLPGSRIKVRLKAGIDRVPPTVVRAMLLLIGSWYENREETVIGISVGALPTFVAVDALLCNDRRLL